eukprot:scaffold570_cov234-Pinguiococcus_pyrenoidosus.AAC.6
MLGDVSFSGRGLERRIGRIWRPSAEFVVGSVALRLHADGFEEKLRCAKGIGMPAEACFRFVCGDCRDHGVFVYEDSRKSEKRSEGAFAFMDVLQFRYVVSICSTNGAKYGCRMLPLGIFAFGGAPRVSSRTVSLILAPVPWIPCVPPFIGNAYKPRNDGASAHEARTGFSGHLQTRAEQRKSTLVRKHASIEAFTSMTSSRDLRKQGLVRRAERTPRRGDLRRPLREERRRGRKEVDQLVLRRSPALEGHGRGRCPGTIAVGGQGRTTPGRRHHQPTAAIRRRRPRRVVPIRCDSTQIRRSVRPGLLRRHVANTDGARTR